MRQPVHDATLLRSLADFQREHQEDYKIRRLGVFGSTARGSASTRSDVDVVVELDQPDLLLLVAIKQDLETLLERPVDIVRLRERMNPFLKRRIEQEAV